MMRISRSITFGYITRKCLITLLSRTTMAGNKFDTPFRKAVVKKVRIEYVGLYKTPIAFEGSIDQAIRHLTSLK